MGRWLPDQMGAHRRLSRLAVLFTLALAACGSAPNNSPDWGVLEIAPATDVLIGVAGLESLAPTPRTQASNALTLALTDTFELAGHRLGMVQTPGSCAEAAQEFVATAGLVAVVLFQCGDQLEEALSLLQGAHVTTILVTDHGALPVAEAPVVRLSWSDADAAPFQGGFLSRFLAAEGVLVVRGESEAAKGAVEAFRLGQESEGVRILGELAVPSGDSPEAVAREVRDSGAPALYLALEPTDALALIKALAEGGSTVPILLAPFTSDPELFGGRLDGAADGVNLTRVRAVPEESERFDAWRGRYTDRFDVPLQEDDLAPFLYDGLTALVRALQRVAAVEIDGTLRVDRYRLYTAARDGEAVGVAGPLRFTGQGDRVGPTRVDILQVQGADLVLVQ